MPKQTQKPMTVDDLALIIARTVATKEDLKDFATKEDIAGIMMRFDGVDQRLNRMDQRFDRIDQRLDRMGQRFDAIDARFDTIELYNTSVHHDHERRIAVLEDKIHI